MEIPNVGIFYIRNKVAGVKFNDYLISDTRVQQLCLIVVCFEEDHQGEEIERRNDVN